MTNYGLDKRRIEKIIREEFDKNPDLKYYIEDSNTWSAFESLISGVSRAIEENTKEVIKQIEREIRR